MSSVRLTREVIALAAIRQLRAGPMALVEEALRVADEDGIEQNSAQMVTLRQAMSRLEAVTTSLAHDTRTVSIVPRMPFDLADFVQTACDSFAAPLADSGVELRCARFASYLVMADSHAICAALSALVSNAIAATPRGEILVSTDFVSKSEDSVVARFSVTDTGFGVHPRARARLETALHGGNGVASGLGLVAAIAKQAGGAAGYESELGHGANFWFSVRLARAVVAPRPSLAARRLAADLANETSALADARECSTLDAAVLLDCFSTQDEADDLASACDTFLRESRARILEIEAAIQLGDGDIFARSSHALKGSCANFGATRLMHIASELETRARRKDIPRILAANLETELNEVQRALDTLVASLRTSSSSKRVA